MGDQLWMALAAGAGTGLMTAARRMAMKASLVDGTQIYDRVRHACAGFVLAYGVGFSGVLLLWSTMEPTRLLGLLVLMSICWDLTTSEGLAYVAKRFLGSNGNPPNTGE